MHILWGCLTAVIGLALFVGGYLKTEFILYRLLVARSKLLWGENVHKFHQVAGLMVTVFGNAVIGPQVRIILTPFQYITFVQRHK